ncbi:MAG: flagellum biosynthesis protein FlbT [Azospirillum sp.]|nr:flagellum biosynthesis protein FlbT [Azospirillum sp.]
MIIVVFSATDEQTVPLLIKLAPSEKIVINGVVIENAGGNSTLRILNQANVLRAKDILTYDEAGSPARRIYYALQCLYLFSEDREKYLDLVQTLMIEFVTAAPSSEPLISQIIIELDQGDYYQTLKTARRLLDHEQRILDHAAAQ